MRHLPGFGSRAAAGRWHENPPVISHVLRERVLNRVLCFTGHTIDDVVNNPLVKNQVLGYYKLHKFVERGSDITDLERQWNSVA